MRPTELLAAPAETADARRPASPGQLHPAHRLWRMIPSGPRRRALAHGLALLAPRPDRLPPTAAPGLIVAGELARASGLGEAARLVHAAVASLGMPAFAVDLGSLVPGDAPDLPAPPSAHPPPHVPLLISVNSPMVPLAAARLGRGLMRGRRVIGHWVWELETAPPTWRAGLGFVHEIWTPSHFAAAALAPLAARRGIPIRIVPHPLAASPPRPAPLDRAAFGLPAEAVITLVSASLASSFARKNPLAAVRAHRAAFGDRPDRVLVLKIGHARHYSDDLAALHTAAEGAANIRFETRTLPTADSHALTACADIVLSLHRSEGFGLVPAEAMLLGKPVIATGWSGNMEFMDADSAALVGFDLVPAEDARGSYALPGAVWAEPRHHEAVVQLRRLTGEHTLRAALGARGKTAATARLGTGPLATALASPLPARAR